MKKAAWIYLTVLFVVALLADFIANDRPIVAGYGGQTWWPVLREAKGEPDWKKVQADWAVWPPIRFRAGASDLGSANYKKPGTRGHWLGTDRLGRDTTAGLVSGIRIAVVVGVGTLLLSLLIGLPLGGIAGFFGDDTIRRPRYLWWGGALGLVVAVVYLGAAYWKFAGTLPVWWKWISAALVLMTVVALVVLLFYLLSRLVPSLRKTTPLPLNTVVLQVIELFNSVPALVLLIALLSLASRPSIWIVVIVIGVLQWTAIARHLRAELLRIRELPYVEAARVSGISNWRLLLVHALPNALGPLLVVCTFGIGGAILSESMLSFLGIGVPADQVTWGSMLRQSRDHPSAWWLAVFPGLLLTLTVLALNAVAEETKGASSL